MGQHDPADAVPDGVDGFHAGAVLGVHQDAAALRGDADLLQAQVLRGGAAAHAQEDLLRRDRGLPAVRPGHMDRQAGLGPLDAVDPRLQQQVRPVGLQDLLQRGDHLGILGHENVGQHFHDGDLRAQPLVNVGHFHADDAPADDAQALRDRLQGEGAGAVHHALQVRAGNGHGGGDGAGGDDGPVEGDFHRVLRRPGLNEGGGFESRRALDHGDPVGAHQAGHAGHQLFHHLGLPLLHGGEVHGDRPHGDAVGRGLVGDGVVQVHGVDQGLGGDAARVQAGPAQGLLFNQSDVRAQLGRPDGGHIAARPSADNGNLHLSCLHIVSVSPRIRIILK